MEKTDVNLIQFHDLHPELYHQFMSQKLDFWEWLRHWFVSVNLIDPRIQGNEKYGWEVTYIHNNKVRQIYGQHPERQTSINQMMDAVFKLIELDEIDTREEAQEPA